MSVKIVIGLGNSGAKYSDTRHNAGRIAIEGIAADFGASFIYEKYCAAHVAKAKVGSQTVVLAFADGFMNESGVGLKKILAFYKFNISETVVAYDDITLEVGRMKLSKGGSSGGHNGVADIMDKCGNDFARMRIGIGSKPDKRMDLADYVLGRLSSEDIAALRRIKFAECLTLLASKGLAAAQNEINRREAKASEPKADSKADGAEKASDGAAKAVSEEGETKKRGIISRLFGI